MRLLCKSFDYIHRLFNYNYSEQNTNLEKLRIIRKQNSQYVFKQLTAIGIDCKPVDDMFLEIIYRNIKITAYFNLSSSNVECMFILTKKEIYYVHNHGIDYKCNLEHDLENEVYVWTSVEEFINLVKQHCYYH